MSILVVGSVAFDTVKTPFGEADRIVGGSATHFALAASLFADVNVVAVVGEDFAEGERRVFEGRPIDLSGLQVAEGKSFRWGGEYSYDFNDRKTLFTELNVFEDFRPVIPDSYRESELVFLGNIHPELQIEVIDQVKSPRLVAADTMNYWIERTPQALADMLKRVNALLLNDAEARQLSGEYSLIRAAQRITAMGPEILVIKRGEHGVLLFAENDRFAVPGFPLETVIDPTGAGDTFAGGFMGHLAAQGTFSTDSFRQAVVVGSVVGSFCVEDFGTRRLEAVSRDEVMERCREFRQLTDFEVF